jgi:hypothetical protein
MDPTLRCGRCGEPIPADGGSAGGTPTCPRCTADESALGPRVEDSTGLSEAAPAAAEAPPPVFIPLHPSSTADRVVTRSMLLPIPGMTPGPSDAMIGRLEPGSLRWIELSDALRVFLGRDRQQLIKPEHPPGRPP